MISLRRIQSIVSKEFKQLRRDRISFGMIIMIPLVELLLFGYAINTDVREIPVGVVDMSQSTVARVITEAVKATQVVNVAATYATPKEAEMAIVAGEIRAALVLPVNLTQRISRGETVGQWLVDGSDTMISAALLQLQQMPLNAVLIDPGLPYAQRVATFDVALFFNPERRSAVNIVPGITAIILTMTMILFTAVAIVREKERGNMELLITTPIRPIELMVGKIFPYIFVGLIQVAIILGLGRVIFDVPINGGLIDIFLATLLFISASLTLGLIISTIATTQLQAMQMTVFILLPSILLSGFMFPYEAMPIIAQYISEALPATHFMRMIRGIVLRGAEIQALVFDSLWLGGFTVVGLMVASYRFNKTLD
ncbi:ABC transporter permease [Oceanicoccus sp. KOV_DT_Chl]|uniref:ABC transporter permease n=1 Tax=Oceanicoccus sp. KOV_DT_Chl TaxID=1904639 RepID=UPI000C7D9159|nr:ABC transporter permease [Oceanicoccus sp. KOV_DT_Chl]